METNNIELITKMVIEAINRSESKSDGFMVPIGVSARHVHLSKEDLEILFGEDYELIKKVDLSQPGQYACNEQVTLKGPKNSIERVRILAPLRNETQVEISRTDSFTLGITISQYVAR